MSLAWHVAALSNLKKLPPLASLLEERPRQMSSAAVEDAFASWAGTFH